MNAVCRLMGISKRSYYQSRSPEQRLEEGYQGLRRVLEQVITANPGYGYRRLRVALADKHGLKVNHKLLKKLLCLWGLQLQRRIRAPSRSLVRGLGRRANLLLRVVPCRCLQVVLSEVTEICYAAGKAYLAVHMDEYGKLVLGWCLSARANVELVLDSFSAAITRLRQLGARLPGLIVHQDRGSVYTSDSYAATVRRQGCLLSYSRRGQPGDNAVNEAFFSRLKVEWASLFYEARTLEQLRAMVQEAMGALSVSR